MGLERLATSFSSEKGRFAAPDLAMNRGCAPDGTAKWIHGQCASQVMSSAKVLSFGLPKGSLQEATIQKMAKAGFNIQVSDRSYVPYVDDDELKIRLIRAQEISRYVEHGYLDCGITGHDWIVENGSKVHEVGEIGRAS